MKQTRQPGYSKLRVLHGKLRKVLGEWTTQLGVDHTIGYLATMCLKLHTDEGRPGSRALVPLAGALAGQTERVSLESMELFRQVFLALRNRDVAALEALDVDVVQPPEIYGDVLAVNDRLAEAEAELEELQRRAWELVTHEGPNRTLFLDALGGLILKQRGGRPPELA